MKTHREKPTRMREVRIFIGLNDSETLTQKYDSSLYISVLKDVCYSYHVPFSFHMIEGGYLHENGDYTQEHTLVLILIDPDEQTAEEIAKDLCAFFNQESVIMTYSDVKAVYVRESLTDEESGN